MTQTDPTGQDTDNIGSSWHRNGFSTIPILPDGTKRPAVRWAEYMTRPPTGAEVESWWGGGSDLGVAVVCGQVSGNVEMLELESAATTAEALFAIHQECKLRGISELWDDLSLRMYAEMTPTGGLHMIYRIADHDVPGNMKVAQVPDPLTGHAKTLAETRGQGGYVIVAPTGGQCHPTGEAWVTVSGQEGDVALITWSQRQAVVSALHAALDRMPAPLPAPPPRPLAARYEGLRPGDDFNVRASWDSILSPHGWTIFSRRNGTTYWTRPGKDRRDGQSATTGHSDSGDRMYCFSSSAGLPVEEPMTKLYVHALLNHGGDMSTAVRGLAALGYGDPLVRSDDVMTASITAGTVEVRRTAELDSTGEVPRDLFDSTESDVGNAERLEQRVRERYGYNHTKKGWMMYTGTDWVEDNVESVMELAREVAREIINEGEQMMRAATTKEEMKAARRHFNFGLQSASNYRLRAMVAQVQSFRSVAVTSKMFDRHEGKVNLRNGLLDLDTYELIPHAPEQYSTMMFGAEYKPSAQAPRFTKMMADLFPDQDVRGYVQRALGYTLTGASNERAFFLLHGPAGTGKSTLTRLMVRLFGDYGHVASEDTFQLNHNMTTTSLHELRKKRFVCSSELPRDAGMNENLLKRITGGDPITSRTLYQREQTWFPECTLWVATNFLPRISGDDDALWRRAKVVEMAQQFGVPGHPEVKNLAEEILAQEADGILNWLLEGLRMYREQGLVEPDSILELATQYRNESDPVAAFMAEQLESGAVRMVIGAMMPVKTLYAQYEEFCRANRFQAFGVRRMAARMRGLDYRSTKYGGRQMWENLEFVTVDRFMIGS